MLIVASTTATSPSAQLRASVGVAGDQDRADQDDAVDRVGAGHQRRVQRRGDLGDHLEADEDAEDEDRQPDDGLAHALVAVALQGAAGRLVPDVAVVGDARSRRRSRRRSRARRRALVGSRVIRVTRFDDVLGVEPRGRARHLRRHVRAAPDLGVADPHRLGRAAEPSTLPPVSAARSTTTDPGFICSTISRGDQQRRVPAGDGGGGDQHVGGGDVRRQQLALPLRAVLGHLAGVAAGALQASRARGRSTRRPSSGSPRPRRRARRTP